MRRRTRRDVEDTSGGGGEAGADDTGRDTPASRTQRQRTLLPAGTALPSPCVGDHYDNRPLRGGLVTATTTTAEGRTVYMLDNKEVSCRLYLAKN